MTDLIICQDFKNHLENSVGDLQNVLHNVDPLDIKLFHLA